MADSRFILGGRHGSPARIAALVSITGLIYEFAAGRLNHGLYHLATGIALAGAFLLIWVNAAVGIVGNEDDPANLLYGAVLAAGLTGGIVARFEPTGMARSLYAVALVHGLIAAIVLPAGPRTLMLNGFFIALWLVSATLFRKVARDLPTTASDEA